jgi:hypothetical protein
VGLNKFQDEIQGNAAAVILRNSYPLGVFLLWLRSPRFTFIKHAIAMYLAGIGHGSIVFRHAMSFGAMMCDMNTTGQPS